MIKVKISAKEQINEELSYSTKLNDEIYSFADGYIKGKHKENFKMFQVPILDLLKPNDNILNGAIAFNALNLKKQSLKGLEKFWLPNEKRFSFDAKSKLSKVKMPVYVSLDKLDKASARISLFDLDNDDIQVAIEIDPKKHVNKDRLLRVDIKHELQHLTQVVNDLMVNYYNALKKTKNINDLSRINFSIDVKYGLGKKSSLSRTFDSYLERDIEYKPWLSMMVERYVNWLMNKKIITQDTIRQKKDSINDLAIKLLKYLLDNLEKFGEQTGSKGVSFIRSNRNKKSFISDFLRELVGKLSELA